MLGGEEGDKSEEHGGGFFKNVSYPFKKHDKSMEKERRIQ